MSLTEYERLHEQAAELERRGDYRAAIDALEATKSIPAAEYPDWLPGDLDIPFRLAIARNYALLGDFDQAREDVAFSFWTEFIMPMTLTYWPWVTDQAPRLSRVMPGSPAVWVFLGEARVMNQDVDGAVAAYETARQLIRSGCFDALEGSWSEDGQTKNEEVARIAERNLGEAYVEAGRYEEGRTVLQPFVEAHPDDEEAWAYLGYAYGRDGNLLKGYEFVTKAISVCCLSTRYYWWAALYAIEGLPLQTAEESCRAAYDAAIQGRLGPGEGFMSEVADLVGVLMERLVNEGKPARAREWLSTASYCDPARAREAATILGI